MATRKQHSDADAILGLSQVAEALAGVAGASVGWDPDPSAWPATFEEQAHFQAGYAAALREVWMLLGAGRKPYLEHINACVALGESLADGIDIHDENYYAVSQFYDTVELVRERLGATGTA